MIDEADARTEVLAHLRESAQVMEETVQGCAADIARAAELLGNCLRAGGKILLCGNGGSAADCQHLAAEFVSRLTRDFDRPAMAAIALTTDTSILTAYANDAGFDGVFARQVQALGRPGDVLLAISTSGSSPNILRAATEARVREMTVVALTGQSGTLADLADAAVCVPSRSVQHVQEAHLAIEHLLCRLVELDLYGGAS